MRHHCTFLTYAALLEAFAHHRERCMQVTLLGSVGPRGGHGPARSTHRVRGPPLPPPGHKVRCLSGGLFCAIVAPAADRRHIYRLSLPRTRARSVLRGELPGNGIILQLVTKRFSPRPGEPPCCMRPP